MALVSFTSIQNGTSPEASQVNNPLTTIYNEFNGNITAANLASNAVTTPKLADASVTADKLGGWNYQSNTTNSQQSGLKIQSGWGFVTGTGGVFATKSITFPVAFSSTPTLVLCTTAGFKSGSDPTSQADVGGPLGGSTSSSAPTSTTVDVRYTQGSSFNSTVRVLYTWIAIGPA